MGDNTGTEVDFGGFFLDSLNVETNDNGELIETGTEQQESGEIDGQESSNSEDLQEEIKELAESEEDTEEKGEEDRDRELDDEQGTGELNDSTLVDMGDGETASIAELKQALKSNKEIRAESTRRFQEAAEMRKKAEADTEQSEALKTQIKTTLESPEAMLNFYRRYAPDVFDRAMRMYAQEQVEDDEALQRSETEYRQRVQARENAMKLQQEREELELKKREYEKNQRTEQEKAYQAKLKDFLKFFDNTVPGALEKAELKVTGADQKYLTGKLKELIRVKRAQQKTWMTEAEIIEDAKELAMDPAIKAYISSIKKNGKAEEDRQKRTLNKASPEPRKKGPISFNKFFSNLG